MSYDFNGLMLRKIKWFWRIFFCLFQRKVYSIFWLLRVFGWAGRTNKKFSHLCYCLFSTYCFHSLKKSPKDCIIHLLSNKLRKNSYRMKNRLHILLSYTEKEKLGYVWVGGRREKIMQLLPWASGDWLVTHCSNTMENNLTLAKQSREQL